jgi:hypothetical protein
LDSTHTNYFLARQKVVFKQCQETKVTKRYDIAITPFERRWLGRVSPRSRTATHAVMAGIPPGRLYRRIRKLTA